jgi:hypothetical protein
MAFPTRRTLTFVDDWQAKSWTRTTGSSLIDEPVLMFHIARAHNPNVTAKRKLVPPGPGYYKWPLLRYSSLLDPAAVAPATLRLVSGIKRIDGRKRAIISEDFGLGFAGVTMRRLGVNWYVTKHELRRLREVWAVGARAWGVSRTTVEAVANWLSTGLKGADLIGYSRKHGKWVILEAKGSSRDPATTAASNLIASAMSQLATTTASSTPPAGLAVSRMISICFLSRSPAWQTTVYVDDPPDEGADDASLSTLIDAAIATIHYDWVAGLLHAAEPNLEAQAHREGDMAYAMDLGADTRFSWHVSSQAMRLLETMQAEPDNLPDPDLLGVIAEELGDKTWLGGLDFRI